MTGRPAPGSGVGDHTFAVSQPASVVAGDRASIPNSATWLAGLAAAGRYGGKLYGVPYYAGSRVVTYRTDLFKKAGVKVPTSLAELTAIAKKLGTQNSAKGFSPIYIAGTDWYVAMSFVAAAPADARVISKVQVTKIDASGNRVSKTRVTGTIVFGEMVSKTRVVIDAAGGGRTVGTRVTRTDEFGRKVSVTKVKRIF